MWALVVCDYYWYAAGDRIIFSGGNFFTGQPAGPFYAAANLGPSDPNQSLGSRSTVILFITLHISVPILEQVSSLRGE